MKCNVVPECENAMQINADHTSCWEATERDPWKTHGPMEDMEDGLLSLLSLIMSDLMVTAW